MKRRIVHVLRMPQLIHRHVRLHFVMSAASLTHYKLSNSIYSVAHITIGYKGTIGNYRL
jgi:hypothetical protein